MSYWKDRAKELIELNRQCYFLIYSSQRLTEEQREYLRELLLTDERQIKEAVRKMLDLEEE